MTNSYEPFWRLLRRLTFCLLFLGSFSGFSQIDQVKADSFKTILRNFEHLDVMDSGQLSVLYFVGYWESNFDSVLYYSSLLIDKAKQSKSPFHHHRGLLQKGTVFSERGSHSEAIRYFVEAEGIAKDHLDLQSLIWTYAQIGKTYTSIDVGLCLQYFENAIELAKQDEDLESVGMLEGNLGFNLFLNDSLEQAKHRLTKSLELTELYNPRSLEYVRGNLALVEFAMGEMEAERRLEDIIQILQQKQDQFAVADYRTHMAEIYLKQGRLSNAINAAEEALPIALEMGLKDRVKDASHTMYRVFQKQRDYAKALKYHEQYIAYRDSINNMQAINRMADERVEFEISLKQAELDLVNVQKREQSFFLWATVGFAALLLMIVALIYFNNRQKTRVNAVLKSQKEDLERLNSTKDRFFSIISHDLRGPVTAFNGVARMIRFMVEHQQTDQLVELARDIDDSVDRLSSLLDNLLNWAVQQQGEIPYVPEKIIVHEMVDDLFRTFRTMADSKEIELSAVVDTQLVIWGDNNTVVTIVRNLVSNALKFTEEKGKVEVRSHREGQVIILEVEDNGVGIPSEKLEQLFQLKAQERTFGTHGEKGLGLGLQLVKEFMQMNHGILDVRSQEGQGTLFVLRFPAYSEERVLTQS